MAKKQFLDYEGLEELAKHIPQIIAGENITITPDTENINKITISSNYDQTSLVFATNTEINGLFI